MIKKNIFAPFVILITLFSLNLVISQENETNTYNLSNDTARLNKSEDWDSRCLLVNEIVSGRINKLIETRDIYFKGLDNVSSILQDIIIRADEVGMDASKLEEEKERLDERIEKFKKDYDLFIERLERSRNNTCRGSEAQFRGLLSEARIALEMVVDDIDSLKQIYRTSIKRELNLLKTQSYRLDNYSGGPGQGNISNISGLNDSNMTENQTRLNESDLNQANESINVSNSFNESEREVNETGDDNE